jgi:hypothetical protein
LTTCDAINEEFGSSGDSGDKSTKSRGGVAAHAGGNRAMMLATLMPTPSSLHYLWQEYEFGVGGRKAATIFSKYLHRKIAWYLISGLVRQGHTADAGIDRIHAVYGGQTSVSNIINGLKRDKERYNELKPCNLN